MPVSRLRMSIFEAFGGGSAYEQQLIVLAGQLAMDPGTVRQPPRTPPIAATPTLIPSPTIPGTVRPLPTGGEIFEELLTRPRVPPPPVPPPPTVFEELLRRPPQTEFERLLNRPRSPSALPTVMGAIRTAAGSAAGLIAGLLWPSEIGWEEPVRQRRRPRRVRDRTQPAPAVGPDGSLLPQRPQSPPRTPQATVDRAPSVPKTPPAVDTAARYRVPSPDPGPIEASRPAPLPASPTFSLPQLLPLLSPLLFLTPSTRPDILSGFRPGRTVAPLTGVQPQPLPSGFPGLSARSQTAPMTQTDSDCICDGSSKRTRTKRKRCSNPIVSKRTRTENGSRFLTITRELKCP